MKYLSLIKIMRAYGFKIKDYHRLVCVETYLPNFPVENGQNCAPFSIRPSSEIEATTYGFSKGQELKHLNLLYANASRHRANIPTSIDVPPLLEIEYMRTKKEPDLNDEILNVLEQLGYLFITCLLTDYNSTVGHNEWINMLNAWDTVIDVEDIEDTPVILSKTAFPSVKFPTVRSWRDVLRYETNVWNLILACNDGNVYHKLYRHLPIIFSMFMVDYYGTKLDNWSKQTRLSLEQKMREIVVIDDRIDQHHIDMYTYGCALAMTNKDYDLLIIIFNFMRDKLQKINQSMDKISTNQYLYIKGPDVRSASVVLSDISINWDDEIDRMETEEENETE